MKNNFNTDDINIDTFRNEFKRYIKCGLTVDEAIKKFNDNNCFILNGYGFEVYRSLCGTIELEYVHHVGSITTDQEIESIRKNTKLKELYKKREECKAHIDDLMTEFNNINDEIYKEKKHKMNVSEDQNKDQFFNTILSAYMATKEDQNAKQ